MAQHLFATQEQLVEFWNRGRGFLLNRFKNCLHYTSCETYQFNPPGINLTRQGFDTSADVLRVLGHEGPGWYACPFCRPRVRSDGTTASLASPLTEDANEPLRAEAGAPLEPAGVYCEPSSSQRRYDHRNCQSLFGYAQEVHRRSGAACELCFAGRSSKLCFDLWRQLTVEHLIGDSQGGYLRDIRSAVERCYPSMPWSEREAFAGRIDAANTITACSFCNATTSHDKFEKRMDEIITEAHGTPEEMLKHVVSQLKLILEKKRASARWKLEAVRAAFEADIRPSIEEARGRWTDPPPPIVPDSGPSA